MENPYKIILVYGKAYKNKRVIIDMVLTAETLFGMTRSEAKRLIDQGGVSLHIPKNIKLP